MVIHCSQVHPLAKVVAEKKKLLGLLLELFSILKYFTTGIWPHVLVSEKTRYKIDGWMDR